MTQLYAYIFTVNSGDSVPGTIWNYLEGIYTSGSTSRKVGELKVNQQLYTRSEFKYGIQYIGPIFQRLQYAYNYKTTGNKNTAPAAGTAWPVTLPVYAMTKRGFPAPESGFPVPGPAAGPLLAIGGLRLLYRTPSGRHC